ncbi:MAG: SagB family peptide dehydrogenase [Actinomycetota bacterium]|jgi:SagB-type dehydrogenase family enzyme|nr:SagB family peptide dehydrogenase [Actinomycetota bacterium]
MLAVGVTSTLEARMRRLRHDLNHLISAGLFLVAVAAILTGTVAHLWDLNDFSWHTYSGYAMTAFALAHVCLNWRKMVAYARFRFRPTPTRGPAPSRQTAAKPAPALLAGPLTPAVVGRATGTALLSRRGLLGLGVGGLAGVFAGRGLRPPPVIPGGADVGVVYHEWSKPGVLDAIGAVADWGERPPQYKTYPAAESIALPPPAVDGGLPTEEAIARRHSTRNYSGTTMGLDELSRVLWSTCGMNHERGGLRSHPSSGALYPIEVYPVVHNVDGLEPGVYHYGLQDHSLASVRAGDLRAAVVRQGLMQEFLGQANVVLVLTVIFQRMRFKYQDRSYRYGLIEAGHIGQNTYLAATSMGLGACAVGAFMDDAINKMLDIDGRDEAAVYMVSVGRV